MAKNRHQRVELTKDLLVDLWINEDMSLAEISKRTGYSQTHLSRMAKKFNIKKNKSVVYQKINKSRKNTFLERYGKNHYMQSDEGYAGYKKALVETVGEDNIAKLEKTQEKRRKNCLEKYGVDHTLKVDSIRKKQTKTLIENFGSLDNFKSEMSKSSSLKCQDFNGCTKSFYSGKFGSFWVRSLLERNVLMSLEDIDSVELTEYEKRIKIKDRFRLPDFHIKINGIDIILEAKYHRYCRSKPYESGSWTSKYHNMWKNSQDQINDIRSWCIDNGFLFLVVTEINLNRLHHLLKDLLLQHNLFQF